MSVRAYWDLVWVKLVFNFTFSIEYNLQKRAASGAERNLRVAVR